MSSQRPRRSTARTRLPPASVSSKSITVPKAGAAASAASRSRPAPGASWPCADRLAPTTVAAKPPRSRRRCTAEPSVLREIGIRLGELRPLPVAIDSEPGQRAVIALRGLDRADRARRGGGAGDRPEAVRHRLLRRLELGERLLRHLRGEVKLAEQRADRHHLVLHRNVLLARIVALGGHLHRRDRRLALALGEGQPRGRRFLLDPRLAGPVFVLCGNQLRLDFIEMPDFGAGGRQITSARGAERTGEIGDRLRRRELAVAHRQMRGLRPLAAVERVTRRDRRQTRVDAERGVGEVGESGGRVDELLSFAVLGHLQIGGDHEIEEVGQRRRSLARRIVGPVILGGLPGSDVGMHRILPHAENRVDVRGHVQRVRRLRCDLVVAPRGLDAHRGQRREIIAVDQVVGDTRMVRVLFRLLIKDRCRLKLLGEQLDRAYAGAVTEEGKERTADSNWFFYQRLIEACVQTSRLREAFLRAEEGSSRSLRDELARVSLPAPGLPKPLVAEESALLERLRVIDLTLRATDDTDGRAQLINEFRTVQERISAIWQEMESHPEAAPYLQLRRGERLGWDQLQGWFSEQPQPSAFVEFLDL